MKKSLHYFPYHGGIAGKHHLKRFIASFKCLSILFSVVIGDAAVWKTQFCHCCYLAYFLFTEWYLGLSLQEKPLITPPMISSIQQINKSQHNNIRNRKRKDNISVSTDFNCKMKMYWRSWSVKWRISKYGNKNDDKLKGDKASHWMKYRKQTSHGIKFTI